VALYTEAPIIKRQYLDNSGNPLDSGKLYTLSSGGTWPANAVTTYQTANGTAHTNPIILDSSGRIPGSSDIFLQPGQSYKFICAASTEDYLTPLWTIDGIGAVPASTVNVDISGTAGVDLPAGSVAFMAKGSEPGSLTSGSFYKTDADAPATSIDALTVVMNPDAISAGGSGTFRMEGDIDVPTTLTPGAAYFVSGTAGELTATPPANAKYVGQAKSTSVLTISPNPYQLVTPHAPYGRLTLTSGTPVTTGDVTAATTLYFTPYQGTNITLYNGTLWVPRTLSEISIAVPATTATVYDVFIYDDNAGVPKLELTAWTNDTTRATALTTLNGFYVKTGATTRLYLGSFRTGAVSGQTEDSLTKRYLWNYYNRVNRPMRVLESTATWVYSTGTYRQANAAATNQLDFVVGVAEVLVWGQIDAAASSDVTGPSFVAIGEDSTSTPSTGNTGTAISGALGNTGVTRMTATLLKYPAAGRHTWVWLEKGNTSSTTWQGTANGQSGISGTYWA